MAGRLGRVKGCDDARGAVSALGKPHHCANQDERAHSGGEAAQPGEQREYHDGRE